MSHPMHPRRRLAWIIHDTKQLIADVESWNSNRTEHPPFDCESQRVTLSLAQQATDEWDRGDIAAAKKTIDRLVTYSKAEQEKDAA